MSFMQSPQGSIEGTAQVICWMTEGGSMDEGPNPPLRVGAPQAPSTLEQLMGVSRHKRNACKFLGRHRLLLRQIGTRRSR
jgi:hypothetical protein